MDRAPGKHRRSEAEPLRTAGISPAPMAVADPEVGAAGPRGAEPWPVGPQASDRAPSPAANVFDPGADQQCPPDLGSGAWPQWDSPLPEMHPDHPSAPISRVRAPIARARQAPGQSGPGRRPDGDLGRPAVPTYRLQRRPGAEPNAGNGAPGDRAQAGPNPLARGNSPGQGYDPGQRQASAQDYSPGQGYPPGPGYPHPRGYDPGPAYRRAQAAAEQDAAAIRQQAAAIRRAAEQDAAAIRQQAAAIRRAEQDAAAIRQQAAAIRRAEQDAAPIRQQAAAIRRAEQEVTQLSGHLLAMSGELRRVSAYLNENLGSPGGLATMPAPDLGPATAPATAPPRPRTRPDAPTTRPARPRTRSAKKPQKQSSQYQSMRLAGYLVAALLLFAVATGATEFGLHGFDFFVFRSGGTGETSGTETDQQFLARQKAAAHHIVAPKDHRVIKSH